NVGRSVRVRVRQAQIAAMHIEVFDLARRRRDAFDPFPAKDQGVTVWGMTTGLKIEDGAIPLESFQRFQVGLEAGGAGRVGHNKTPALWMKPLPAGRKLPRSLGVGAAPLRPQSTVAREGVLATRRCQAHSLARTRPIRVAHSRPRTPRPAILP